MLHGNASGFADARRAFGNDGFGTSFNLAKPIRFATDNGAQVINMSFGLLLQEYLIKDAVDYAAQNNVVLEHRSSIQAV